MAIQKRKAKLYRVVPIVKPCPRKGRIPLSLHSFDPDVACKVGINAAVIYQNFVFWCQKNAANRKQIRDGYVWTYNSRRALSELFPYLTESQIKTAISKLLEVGLLVKGEYNVAAYDKTNWYSPAVSAEWVSAIGQKSPMDWSKIANGLAKNRQPIPDSKPDSKPDERVPPNPPKGGRRKNQRFGVSDEVKRKLGLL